MSEAGRVGGIGWVGMGSNGWFWIRLGRRRRMVGGRRMGE